MNQSILVIRQLVLIGASAGGLEPLRGIISSLPDKLPNTAIVVAQHTSPKYESMLAKLLQRSTKIPVVEAKDGESLQPNHIYTCPPNHDARIIKGKFHLVKAQGSGPKPNADKLFESAAKVYKDETVGVVLSGTGHDGSLGMAEIKKHGGITIVQAPETANYTGMPDAAILANDIDMVLSPESIGKEIPKLFEKSYRNSITSELPEAYELKDFVGTKEMLALLHQKTGTDFSSYKTATIHRRLEKRATDQKFDSIEAYLAEIKNNPKELENLFPYLLISVTQFFRDPESIETLREALKLSLVQHPKDNSFRVWVPGCATGEEAYTVAMLINDLIEKGSPRPKQIQIFATDIDQKALGKARIGKYEESSMRSMPGHYKTRYFTKINDDFIVSPEVKKYVLFSKHDLTSNPPFLRLNLVSCRNLLIYFKTSLQNQIIPLFHYTMEPNALLFLGKSESIGSFKNLFETVDITSKVYRRKNSESRISHIPILQSFARPKQLKPQDSPKNEVLTIPDMVKETFYNGYEHPYIVVDDVLNIIEINKDVSFFLTIQSGTPNFNALKLIHKDLRIDIRTLVNEAHSTMATTRGDYRKITRGKETCTVRLKVQPVLYAKIDSPSFIVSFETAKDVNTVKIPHQSNGNVDLSPRMIELEHELASTKEHLNTIVEELETSNEELQSLNEELQSSNEELQASNEELETSNEELQATNEELNVAYTELRTINLKMDEKTQAVKRSQNNLKSVLDNTQQAFILINRDYSVVLFNNHAFNLCKEIFNISLTNGVIYIDLLPADYLPAFHKRFKEALKGKQVSFEQEVVDNRGEKRYLSFNYTPVESASGKRIQKVSLSFIDITQKHKYELELEKAYDQVEYESKLLRNIFDDSPEVIAIFSGIDYTITYANASYQALFPKRDVLNKPVAKVLPEVEEQGFVKLMDEVRASGEAIHRKEVPFTMNVEGKSKPLTRYFKFTYRPIRERKEALNSVVVHAVDITHLVKKRVEVEEERQFMQLISETVPDHLWVLLPDETVEYINEPALKFYGLKGVKSLTALTKQIHPDQQQLFKENVDRAIEAVSKFQIEVQLKSSDNKYYWYMVKGSPLIDGNEHLSKMVISSVDIEAHKTIQKNKDDFMGVASHELKTPLTSAKAYIQLLSEHLMKSDDDKVLKYLNKSNQSINKLETFVSELLDISRIQSGKLILNPALFSMTDLVRDVVDNFEVTTQSHKIILETLDKNIKVVGDKGRLEQVMTNLINNAIKYSPDANEIIVRVTEKIDHIEFSTQDFGVGISDKDLENIFDRFYRVAEHQSKVSGLGIGLNISKEIIQLHGGQIWAESVYRKGSIFYFTIPKKVEL